MSHNCHVMRCYESHVSCSHAVAWARDESAGVVVQYTVYRPQPALARTLHSVRCSSGCQYAGDPSQWFPVLVIRTMGTVIV